MVAFRMLGPFEIREASGQRIPVRRHKQRALLALLVVRSGRSTGADELVDALWGRQRPTSARANLHTYVSDMRRLLAGRLGDDGPRLVTTPTGYRLDARTDDCDAVVFERLAAQGRTALADGRAGEAAELLDRALAMWQGRALEDLESYEWAQPVADRLAEARLRAVEHRADARLHLRQFAEVAAELAEIAAAHPLRETLWQRYLRALYGAGRRPEALIAYGQLRAALADELGVRPVAALQSLHDRMRDGGRGGAVRPAAAATWPPVNSDGRGVDRRQRTAV